MTDEGINRSAILLMSLGEDQAAEVFKYLGPREVQKIGTAMAMMGSVTRAEVSEVLDKFCSEAEGESPLGTDSTEYITTVLRKALGEDKSEGIIDRILHGGDTSGIEGLKWMDAESVAELIKNEHPQVIATIMVHLDRDQASEIITLLPDGLRKEVVLRIASIDGIQPTALKELNDVLSRVLAGGRNAKKRTMGGVRAAAEILNYMPGRQDTEIIDGVREVDAELAQAILDEMFVFENLLEVDDKGIQLLLRDVQSESLIVALKGCSQELRDKIFKNMSQRAGDMLREDLEAKGPVKVSEVETEQKEILKVVRRLADDGQISLGGKGDEAYV
jgi:flagellar motor switch protein FliG